MKRLNASLLVAAVASTPLIAPAALAETRVAVSALAAAPAIDGDLSDWGDNWQKVHIKPALADDDKNRTGELEVELQVGVAGDEVFFAARWPDAQADLKYRPWEWNKRRKKYSRGKDRDDMFAVRFDMAGDFNTCMIEDADYEVDVWLWSAGRSNERDYATDMWHKITLDRLENAAEYETPSGNTVYIQKEADAGLPGFENTRVKRTDFQGDEVPGIEFTPGPRGSIGDVAAKGVWKDGYWHLELKRKLETGHDDDVVLKRGGTKKGQIAFFNENYAEHKSVSDALVFDFSGL
ncbi:ethylbenzene dehydrogenase-related protein [Motiliproteus sp. SC1-56]|uniref:ethylbenzene dehydrogenase-related protein n=1 Tax=Motiliproteus sp. SC1-56 TaxID=2799565 RepID=UPI001A8FE159|nr:ethylbenzene dehydrogenase-related protein [Motiliproteus sp. SC1-56]